MRLKTKLVLAITGLVFLIAGLLSLVYVSHLVDAAIQQSYDANRMVANQVRFALQNALEAGLRDQMIAPSDTAQLMQLADRDYSQTARSSAMPLMRPVMYSLTVNDITITDTKDHIILTTLPGTHPRRLIRGRNTATWLRPIRSQRCATSTGLARSSISWCPRTATVEPFLNVHVGVRTTLLQHVYEPSMQEAITLMAFAAGTALIAAFLLSNLALRPHGRNQHAA